MMSRRLPAAPEGLSEATASLWPGLYSDLVAVTGAPEVDVLQLAELVRTMDRLAAVRAAIDEEGPTTTGSRGQVRAHPLLGAEGDLRKQVAAGFDRLGLSPSVARDSWTEVQRGGRLKRDDYPLGYVEDDE
jgi:P27 family predicted phage terminase small subunit